MYNAFISYSHAADGKMAPALQTALEKFAKPWYKLRNLNVFRDEASLTASPHLWTNIQEALAKSEYLVYMASPVSSSSKWVNKEIEYWLTHKSIDTLLIVLTDGELIWNDETETYSKIESNSLPPILVKEFTEEPFYIDLRAFRSHEDLSLNNPIFKKEVLKLAAHLHGKQPKDLASEEVFAHRKLLRIRNTAIVTLVCLLLISIGAAWLANINANKAQVNLIKAESNQRVADSNAIIARQQRDSAVIARKLADQSAIIAKLQSDTAQIERDNAIHQGQIAVQQRNTALANSLIFAAKNEVNKNPTTALRLAERAMQIQNNETIENETIKYYRENLFYKIIGSIDGGIMSIAISPDGTKILTGSTDHAARMWDLNGNILYENKNHKENVRCVLFSPDGESFLTITNDGESQLWNLQGKLIKEFKSNNVYGIYSIAFSPNGKYILVGSYDGLAWIWDLNGKVVQEFRGHTRQVSSVAFSPDGTKILTCSTDSTARLWDLRGNTLKKFNPSGSVQSVAFSPDGETIATAEEGIVGESTVRIWDLKGENISSNKLPISTYSIEYSTDGSSLFMGALSPDIYQWKIDENINRVIKGQPFHAGRALAISKDGRYLVTGSGTKVVLWLLKGNPIYRYKDHEEEITSIAFSPDGKKIITGSLDSTARLYDLHGKTLGIFKGHLGEINKVAFSPNGKTVVTSSVDNTIRLWDLNGKQQAVFNLGDYYSDDVLFSPSGKMIVYARLGKIIFVDLNGKLVQEFCDTDTSCDCHSLSFSPDGERILCSGGQTIHIWDMKGMLIKKLKFHSSVRSACFSPDSKKIVVGFDKGDMDKSMAYLCDLNGTILQKFICESGINSVAFAPDGKTILTGSDDAISRLWDLKGHVLQEFFANTYFITNVVFSPDGQSILTTSRNNFAILWVNAMPLNDFLSSGYIQQLGSEEKKKFGMY